MYYILCGEDQFSLEEKLREIKAGLGDASMLESNTHELEGQRLTVEGLAAVGSAAPFLAPCRLVIVRGLLERFEPPERGAQPRKSSAGKSNEHQDLADCLKGLPPTTILVLADEIKLGKKGLKNNPLYNLIAPGAEVHLFSQLSGSALFQWIQERVSQKGGAISRQATETLGKMLGGDLFTLNNEIDKLTAFAVGRKIEEKDVREVVSAAQETNIFALVDAVLERRPDAAERILGDLIAGGQNPSQVLNTLARQFSLMFQIKEMKSQKKSTSEMQARTGISSAFIFARTSQRAQRFSVAELKAIFHRLLETDLSIKTGKLEPDLALELLAAELTALPARW